MSNNLDLILKKYKPGKREELIPMLQELQEAAGGYLSEESIVKAGTYLGLSTTKIYGLATFYDTFRFVPTGKVRIWVCNGTSCFMNGSQEIISKLAEETGVNEGQATRDGNFSYDIVTCMGGCHNGPLININGEYHIHVRPEHIPDLVRKLKFIIEND